MLLDEIRLPFLDAGARIQAVTQGTGLRSRENVPRLIDPALLEQANQNDTAPAAAE